MAKKRKKDKGTKKGKRVKPSKIPVTKRPPPPFVESHEWYKAKFEAAEVREGLYGDYLLLKFELLDGYKENSEESAKGLKTNAFANLPVYPDSPQYEFLSAIVGEEFDIGDDIDLTPFYGDKYKVFIEDAKKKKKDGSKKQSISKIKVFKKSSKSKGKKKGKK